MARLILAILLICITLVAAQQWYSVVPEKGGDSLIVVEGQDAQGLAWGWFTASQNETGWGELSITTNAKFSDLDQMFAAGFLEGALTWPEIYASAITMFNPSALNTTGDAVEDWMGDNLNWIEQQIAANPTDSYWIHVNYTLNQVAGILNGVIYAAPADQTITPWQLMYLNANNEAGDIYNSMFDNAPYRRTRESLEHFISQRPLQHCSALIKVTNDLSELFSGHTTWSNFEDMLRMWKTYNFPLQEANTASQIVTFSGYPGALMSQDDFYVTSSKLTVIETTIDFYNPDLYQYITKETVPCWIRAVIANRMAGNGPEWVEVFAKYNSGTYNNQWIVVDYKLFTPGQVLRPNTLTILEQTPGYCEYADMTQTLNFGYWPSYNVPYFEYVFNRTGFTEMVDNFGDWFSFDLSPRASIFRRDQTNVQEVDDMKFIMQYNDWQNDPFADGNPGNQISSRFDLVPANYTSPNTFLLQACFGGIDSKITTSELVDTVSAWAISGPTHEEQPVFSWTESACANTSHFGQPETFDFDWVVFSANTSYIN